MYRVASRLPKRALLAAATGAVLVEKKDKLSIYSETSPDVLLVETTSPLEQQIAGVRKQITGSYQDAHSYLQGWISKWISFEQAVENRVKSIISPNESLTPGLLYVGVATLTGFIISRNRFILTRFLLPPVFLIASANHFLPQTTHNLSEYLGSLEDTYAPTFSEKHEIAKAHTAMSWEMLKDATANARSKANTTALNSVERIQGATGLKIKETLGWGQQAAKKWERKVVEAAHVAEEEVEKVIKAPFVDAETSKFGQEVREKVVEAFHDAEKEVERIIHAPHVVPDEEATKAAEGVHEKVAEALPEAQEVEQEKKVDDLQDKSLPKLV